MSPVIYYNTRVGQWILIAFALILFDRPSRIRAENVDIRLVAEARNDPLVEFMLPIPGSGYRAQFKHDGYYVQSLKSAPSPRAVGFRLFTNISGDFELELDLKIEKLVAPKAGAPQGVKMKLLFGEGDDPIVIGYVVDAKGQRMFTMRGLSRGEPAVDRMPAEFKQGTWFVCRTKDVLKFRYAGTSGKRVDVFSATVNSEALTSIQVFSSKHNGHSGNNVRYERTSLESEHFFVHHERNESGFRLWMLFAAISIGLAVAGAFVQLRSR